MLSSSYTCTLGTYQNTSKEIKEQEKIRLLIDEDRRARANLDLWLGVSKRSLKAAILIIDRGKKDQPVAMPGSLVQIDITPTRGVATGRLFLWAKGYIFILPSD